MGANYIIVKELLFIILYRIKHVHKREGKPPPEKTNPEKTFPAHIHTRYKAEFRNLGSSGLNLAPDGEEKKYH